MQPNEPRFDWLSPLKLLFRGFIAGMFVPSVLRIRVTVGAVSASLLSWILFELVLVLVMEEVNWPTASWRLGCSFTDFRVDLAGAQPG